MRDAEIKDMLENMDLSVDIFDGIKVHAYEDKTVTSKDLREQLPIIDDECSDDQKIVFWYKEKPNRVFLSYFGVWKLGIVKADECEMFHCSGLTDKYNGKVLELNRLSFPELKHGWIDMKIKKGHWVGIVLNAAEHEDEPIVYQVLVGDQKQWVSKANMI